MYLLTHAIVLLAAPLALYYVLVDNQAGLTRLKKNIARLLFVILGEDFRVVDPQHIAPGKAYLVISNYPSFYVFLALLNLFPDGRMVAAAFISRVPVFGFVVGRLGAIFVDPRRPRTTKQAIDRALQGGTRSVILFPEGRRSSAGEINDFQKGLIYILRHTSLDLLPVTANGFFQLKPANRIYLDPAASLELVIHPPIPNAAARKMGDEELIHKVRNQISQAYRPSLRLCGH